MMPSGPSSSWGFSRQRRLFGVSGSGDNGSKGRGGDADSCCDWCAGGLLPHGSLVTQRHLAYQPDRQERYGGAAEEYLIIYSTKEHASET